MGSSAVETRWKIRNRNDESASPRRRITPLSAATGVTSPRHLERKKSGLSLPSVSSRSRSHASVDVEEVRNEELEAKNRVARLRAQLARTERLERELHVEEARKKKREQAIATKAEDATGLAPKLQGIKPMYNTEFLQLATLFNERLRAVYHRETRLHDDLESSIHWLIGKILIQHGDVPFLGFMRMAREVLGFSEVELSESQACRLWMTGLKLPPPKPLDTGASAATTGKPAQSVKVVTLREIADFLRRGGNGESQSNSERVAARRERVASENRAVAKSIRDELIRLMRVPLDIPDDVPEASPAEVRALAEMMNQQMVDLFAPNERTFYRLFRYMDADGNGMIEFDEFEGMVRRELQLNHDDMPHVRLLSLWRAIDADGSGRVCRGEWGRFMRFGSAEVCDPNKWINNDAGCSIGAPKPQVTPRRSRISLGNNPMADAKARLRAHQAEERDRLKDDSDGDIARRLKENARSLDVEAQRLEALIAEKERARRDSRRR